MLNNHQSTLGNKWKFNQDKVQAILPNPSGTVTLIDFDAQPNPLEILLGIVPGNGPKSAIKLLRRVKEVIAQHGEKPEDENFWDYWVGKRLIRNASLNLEFGTIFRYLNRNGYYSRSYKERFANYRLYLRDGVRKGDVILTETEITIVLNKRYPLTTRENIEKQRALDAFCVALLTGARKSDIKGVKRTVDAKGNPIVIFHNQKGAQTQSIAYDPAMDGIFERGLFTGTGYKLMGKALKEAMYETLPTNSNRLISYFYLNPGRGRVSKNDSRISHITMHTARHTFCTRLLRAGVSPALVCQLAGHKNIQTTMRYYSWVNQDDANDKLREIQQSGVLATKTEWGREPELVPLPLEIHRGMLPVPRLGELAPAEKGLVAAALKKRTRPSTCKKKLKLLSIIAEAKKNGTI